MPETDELYNRILSLERQIENIDAKLFFSLAAEPKILDMALSLFKRRPKLIPVYMSVNGHKNVSQIANDLGLDISNTSKYLKELHERGYIDKIDEAKGGAIYRKNQLERILRLSEHLDKVK